jgi:hypothetical protein
MKRTLAKPRRPKRLTEKTVRTYKARMRAYDRDRIALGIASPAAVQRENSLFSKSQKFRILSFPEAHAH